MPQDKISLLAGCFDFMVAGTEQVSHRARRLSRADMMRVEPARGTLLRFFITSLDAPACLRAMRFTPYAA